MRFVDLSVSLSVSLLSLSLLFLPYLSFYLSLLFFPPLSAVTKHSHAVKKQRVRKFMTKDLCPSVVCQDPIALNRTPGQEEKDTKRKQMRIRN